MTVYTLASGSDDGRFQNSVAGGQNAYFSNSETSLSIGSVASGYDYVSSWHRFTSVTASNGTAILTLTDTGGATAGTAGFDVYGVLADDPSAPADQAAAMALAKTTACILNWNPGSGAGAKTLDVTDIMTELFGAYDYTGGTKALMLLVLSRGSTSAPRDYTSQEGAGGATLEIGAGSDTTAPTVSSVSTVAKPCGFYQGWATDEASDSRIKYGTADPPDTFSATFNSDFSATSHSAGVGGLTPGNTYYAYPVSRDVALNVSTYSTAATIALPSARDLLGHTPGDSNMYGLGLSAGEDIPALLGVYFDTRAHVYNDAIGGSTMGEWIGSAKHYAASRVYPFKQATGTTFAVVMATLNDGDTAQALADHWTLCDALRALGMKVVVGTATNRGGNLVAAQDGETHINPGFRTSWRSHADAMVDIQALAHAADPTNATYFQDEVHYTATLAAEVAAAFEPAIELALVATPTNSLLSSSATLLLGV